MAEELTPINLPIPGWNKRKMTFQDFEEVCQREGITVERMRFKSDVRGYCTKSGGSPLIALDKRLRGIKRIQVAFHELCHYFLHVDDPACLRTMNAETHEANEKLTPQQLWAEYEATIAASIAIAPGFFCLGGITYLSEVASRYKSYWGTDDEDD